MISVHDEIRFLVKQEHELLAALALQISNLWVRSLFVYQVGMKDLPLVKNYSDSFASQLHSFLLLILIIVSEKK
jgi:hypothetical protein